MGGGTEPGECPWAGMVVGGLGEKGGAAPRGPVAAQWGGETGREAGFAGEI